MTDFSCLTSSAPVSRVPPATVVFLVLLGLKVLVETPDALENPASPEPEWVVQFCSSPEQKLFDDAEEFHLVMLTVFKIHPQGLTGRPGDAGPQGKVGATVSRKLNYLRTFLNQT